MTEPIIKLPGTDLASRQTAATCALQGGQRNLGGRYGCHRPLGYRVNVVLVCG